MVPKKINKNAQTKPMVVNSERMFISSANTKLEAMVVGMIIKGKGAKA